MNTSKKSVKGMTLVEIIIAMFVFSVTALILVQVGTSINGLAQNANHVNKKVTIEAPIVENGENIIHSDYDDTTKSETLKIYNEEMAPAQGNLRISMSLKGHEVNIAGKSFTVKKAVEDSKYAQSASTNYDLQYVYVSKDLTAGKNIFVDTP